MKLLLTVILFAGLCFAQTTTPPAQTEKPKEPAKAGCCGSGADCCKAMMDKKSDMKADMKKGGCCSGDQQGGMCSRQDHKDAKPDEQKK